MKLEKIQIMNNPISSIILIWLGYLKMDIEVKVKSGGINFTAYLTRIRHSEIYKIKTFSVETHLN